LEGILYFETLSSSSYHGTNLLWSDKALGFFYLPIHDGLVRLQEALEGYRSCSVADHSNPEEVRKRAMADPEIQAIFRDPAMRLILQQMQNDPRALSE